MSRTLLEYCAKVGCTVADVARDANLDPKWLYKVAKGERGFSPETAAAIENATNGSVTPSDLNKVRMAWRAANPKAAKAPAKKPAKKKGAGKKAARPFVRSPAETEAAQ